MIQPYSVERIAKQSQATMSVWAGESVTGYQLASKYLLVYCTFTSLIAGMTEGGATPRCLRLRTRIHIEQWPKRDR